MEHQQQQAESCQVAPSGTSSVFSKSAPSRTVVHAKLEMTTPGDYDELEADRVADEISAGKTIHRAYAGTGDDSGIAVPSHLESRLLGQKGGGFSMPSVTLASMGQAFGRDFSDVRIHADTTSAELSKSIAAKAFTHGNDIFFNQGQYNPSSKEGRHLLAHELVHVSQNSGKIAREPDHAAQRAAIQSYFIGEWRWGTFFMYLSTFHPEVVNKMKLELDDDLAFDKWNQKRGVPFLKEVSEAIVADYVKNKSSKQEWSAAYDKAIKEFQIQRKLNKSIAPVFDALVTLTRNRQAKSNTYEQMRNRSFAESKEQVAKVGNEEVNFEGVYFQNRLTPISNIFNFLHEVYPESLTRDIPHALFFRTESIKKINDIEWGSEDFSRTIEKYLDDFISRRYNEYLDNKKLKPSSHIEDMRYFNYYLIDFENEVEKHLVKYPGARVLLDVINCRQKNLYSREFHVPEVLVSAQAWTELFLDIMAQGVSMFVGGPLIGKIVSTAIAKNPIAKKLIAKAAEMGLDFVSAAGEEALLQKVRGQDLNANAILKAAGMSVVIGQGTGVAIKGAVKGVKGVRNIIKGEKPGDILDVDIHNNGAPSSEGKKVVEAEIVSDEEWAEVLARNKRRAMGDPVIFLNPDYYGSPSRMLPGEGPRRALPDLEPGKQPMKALPAETFTPDDLRKLSDYQAKVDLESQQVVDFYNHVNPPKTSPETLPVLKPRKQPMKALPAETFTPDDLRKLSDYQAKVDLESQQVVDFYNHVNPPKTSSEPLPVQIFREQPGNALAIPKPKGFKSAPSSEGKKILEAEIVSDEEWAEVLARERRRAMGDPVIFLNPYYYGSPSRMLPGSQSSLAKDYSLSLNTQNVSYNPPKSLTYKSDYAGGNLSQKSDFINNGPASPSTDNINVGSKTSQNSTLAESSAQTHGEPFQRSNLNNNGTPAQTSEGEVVGMGKHDDTNKGHSSIQSGSDSTTVPIIKTQENIGLFKKLHNKLHSFATLDEQLTIAGINRLFNRDFSNSKKFKYVFKSIKALLGASVPIAKYLFSDKKTDDESKESEIIQTGSSAFAGFLSGYLPLGLGAFVIGMSEAYNKWDTLSHSPDTYSDHPVANTLDISTPVLFNFVPFSPILSPIMSEIEQWFVWDIIIGNTTDTFDGYVDNDDDNKIKKAHDIRTTHEQFVSIINKLQERFSVNTDSSDITKSDPVYPSTNDLQINAIIEAESTLAEKDPISKAQHLLSIISTFNLAFNHNIQHAETDEQTSSHSSEHIHSLAVRFENEIKPIKKKKIKNHSDYSMMAMNLIISAYLYQIESTKLEKTHPNRSKRRLKKANSNREKAIEYSREAMIKYVQLLKNNYTNIHKNESN